MLKVSALQLNLSCVSTPQQMYDRVRDPIGRAAAGGAELIVLPNYVGLMLLGVAVPSAASTDNPLDLDEIARAGKYPSVASMLREVSPTCRDLFLHIFGSLAGQFHIYLAPGTAVERDLGLYNSACLIGPDGKVIGWQRQTHRSPLEIAWGLAQGESLAVFDVGSAQVGFVVGTDVEYPEVARILALQGATVLIHPSAYHAWPAEHHLVDLWRDVQANQVFGVQACAVGFGRSAVYGPVVGMDDERGILAQVRDSTDEQTVSATLDPAILEKAADELPIFRFFNYGFYERELARAYRECLK